MSRCWLPFGMGRCIVRGTRNWMFLRIFVDSLSLVLVERQQLQMKTTPVGFVAVVAFAAFARSQVTDGFDSREPAPVPVAAPGTARILGGLADGTPPPPAPAKPAFVVPAKEVISTKTIQQGGRTITIQRIQPIPLPPPPPTRAPETHEQAASLEQEAEVSEPQPKWDFLMVGATVFHFKDSPPRTMVTYWPSGKGESVTLWSSADFRLLNGFTEFVAADGHAFRMMRMLSDADVDAIAGLQASEESELPDFSIGKATFTVTGDAPADAQVLAPIAALHEIYNNEHPRLLLAWQGRERARLQHEAERKANPPQPKEVTIRYWRTKTPAPAKGSAK